MKAIILKSDLNGEDFGEDLKDCILIQRALGNAGFFCTLGQARRMWSEYSEDTAAGWMSLPNRDEAIVQILRRYFQVLS